MGTDRQANKADTCTAILRLASSAIWGAACQAVSCQYSIVTRPCPVSTALLPGCPVSTALLPGSVLSVQHCYQALSCQYRIVTRLCPVSTALLPGSVLSVQHCYQALSCQYSIVTMLCPVSTALLPGSVLSLLHCYQALSCLYCIFTSHQLPLSPVVTKISPGPLVFAVQRALDFQMVWRVVRAKCASPCVRNGENQNLSSGCYCCVTDAPGISAECRHIVTHLSAPSAVRPAPYRDELPVPQPQNNATFG